MVKSRFRHTVTVILTMYNGKHVQSNKKEVSDISCHCMVYCSFITSQLQEHRTVDILFNSLNHMLLFTVEPRFNELPRDRGNAFVISRVRLNRKPRYNENCMKI